MMYALGNIIQNAIIYSNETVTVEINYTKKNVKIIKYEGANIYDLFKYKNVIITTTSAKKIEERILNEKNYCYRRIRFYRK